MAAQRERIQAVLDFPCDCNTFPWISSFPRLTVLECEQRNSSEPSITSDSALSGDFTCAYKCNNRFCVAPAFSFPLPPGAALWFSVLHILHVLMVMVVWQGSASPAVYEDALCSFLCQAQWGPTVTCPQTAAFYKTDLDFQVPSLFLSRLTKNPWLPKVKTINYFLNSPSHHSSHQSLDQESVTPPFDCWILYWILPNIEYYPILHG